MVSIVVVRFIPVVVVVRSRPRATVSMLDTKLHVGGLVDRSVNLTVLLEQVLRMMVMVMVIMMDGLARWLSHLVGAGASDTVGTLLGRCSAVIVSLRLLAVLRRL